jgi:hypothetical protein
MSSDNVTSAVNQQERLDPYIAGFVDGEGSFHVAVQRHPTTRLGWQLVPEFHVSQDVSRAEILYLIRGRLGLDASGRTTAAHETPHWCMSCVAGLT